MIDNALRPAGMASPNVHRSVPESNVFRFPELQWRLFRILETCAAIPTRRLIHFMIWLLDVNKRLRARRSLCRKPFQFIVDRIFFPISECCYFLFKIRDAIFCHRQKTHTSEALVR